MLIVLGQNFPSFGCHETFRWSFSGSRETCKRKIINHPLSLCLLLSKFVILITSLTAHSSTRNEIKVVFSSRIEECHLLDFGIVCCDPEGNYLKFAKPRGCREYSCAVTCVVEISIGGRALVWMRHTSGITTDDIKISPSCHSRFSVPLYFRWSGVQHWTWEDCEECVRVKNTFLEDGSMLLDPHSQRYVIIFRPTTEGMEKQNGLFESSLLEQATSRVLEKFKIQNSQMQINISELSKRKNTKQILNMDIAEKIRNILNTKDT